MTYALSVRKFGLYHQTDMASPFPSLTKAWHSKAYPAIDPTRPELSAKGKTIVITGGGGSIGGTVALAFAKAGAKNHAVIGRREALLLETKKNVESQVKDAQVLVVTGDVTNEESMKEAFSKVHKEFGGIGICVANAGYLSAFEPVLKAEPKEWWTGFEINVKSAFNITKAFIPLAAENPKLVNISTCVVHMPAMADASSYVASKLAGTKIYGTVGVENPNIHVVHVHPGVIYSELNVKSGITALDDGEPVPV